MVVSGFEMPEAFVQLCEAIQRGEAHAFWKPKERKVYDDGGGWPAQDLVFDCDPESMRSSTERMREDFPEERGFQDTSEIEDSGFENFVYFAHSGAGMDYFFDFGADPQEPSVVSFREGLWERVAPNFTSFMARYVPVRVDRIRRDALTEWTLNSVLYPDPRAENWPSSQMLPGLYAHLRPEEQREVETEVREELERHGMTDEQRRRLDELWERLRASLAS